MLLVAASFGAARAGSTSVDAAVPVGVKIPVVLSATITTQTARAGDAFAFATAREARLGDLVVPAGTPGRGRLASVVPAHDKTNGSLTLQADTLDLPDGRTIWVNVDASQPLRGHYADRHTKVGFLPIPIFVGAVSTVSGNLILDAGTPFTVVTIPPRAAPAPLVTLPPSPTPTAS
jgi:hypothetical protein